MKEKLIFVVTLLLLVSCTTSGSKSNLEQKEEAVLVITLPSCSEIKHYPVRFSYASDILKDELYAKIQKPLTTSQKEELFKTEFIPYEIHSVGHDVFAIGKINYETATLVVYLVREIQTESLHESDQIVLVLYDKNGNSMDILSETLEDAYGSTYEIEFNSPNEFTVINIDREYSPDPESEAEDIASGRVIEPSYMVNNFKIKELRFEKQ